MADNSVYVLEDQASITNTLINYFQTAQSKITDFNEGAEARNVLESVGISAYQQRFLIDYLFNEGYVHTASGAHLDMIGILVNCRRKQAVQATGPLVISTATAKVEDIVIDSGTSLTCSSDGSLFFETENEVTLEAGDTNVNLIGIASIGGTNGNVLAGKIDTINNPLFDLEVTNPSAFIGGMDQELDAPFRERILESGKGKITGSVSWYKKESGNIIGVHDSVVVDTPLIPTHDMVLYVNGTEKPTPDGVITAVTELFAQEDHKIGGITIQVSKPTFVTQDVTITVTLKSGQTWSAIKPILESDIKCYFNGGTTTYGQEYVGLNGGEGIVFSVLQTIVVNSLGTTFLDYTISAPSGNVLVDEDEAVQLGTITLSEAV